MKEVEKTDLIDELIASWNKERPDLDATAMAIVGRILVLGRLLEKRASRELKKYDIHYTDLDVLATLRRSGDPFSLTPTQLRKSVLITSGAMTALLVRLEKKGLIKRSPDPEDGRVRIVNLTQIGKVLIDQAIESRFEEASTAVQVFSKSEVQQFSQLLKKMTIGIKHQIIKSASPEFKA